MFQVSQKLKNSAFLFFIIAGTFVWTQAYFLSQNYLVKNPYWYSYKNVLEKTGLMGGLASGMSRALIAGNQINLNAAYGHQEVFNTNTKRVTEINAAVSIPDSSYVDIVFNYDKDFYEGIRFSRSSLFPSIFYKSDRSGRFIEKADLPEIINLKKDFKIHIKQDTKGLNVRFADKTMLLPNKFFINGEFGFKSGLLGAHVSSISVVGYDQKIRTDLILYGDYQKVFIGLFNFIILMVFIVAGIYKLISKHNFSKALNSVSLFIFLFGALWTGFDYFYYSRQDTLWDVTLNAPVDINKKNNFRKFEIVRYELFTKVANIFGMPQLNQGAFTERFGTLKNERKMKLPEGTGNKKINVAMFGGSFSTGSGVEDRYPSFFEILHYQIASAKGYDNVMSQNFSRDSWRLEYNFNEILDIIKKKEFQYIVIMNTLHAENANQENRQLEEILSTAKNNHIKVFYVLGVKNLERDLFANSHSEVGLVKIVNNLSQYNLEKAKFITSIKDKYDLVTLDPNTVIGNLEIARSGSLWWDVVHLSAYGHTIVGNYISSEIIKHM